MNFILPSEAKARYAAGFLARVQVGLQRSEGTPQSVAIPRWKGKIENYETALHKFCRALEGI